MDSAPTPNAGGGGKAVVPVPAGVDAGAGASRSSGRVARKATTTLPAVVSAGAADVPLAATAAPGAVSNGGGGGGKEDEDDEQVERFYALLDNIRAMRGAYVPGSDDGTGALDDGVVDTGSGGPRARAKRLRAMEPPWRPAFRLEDFEEPTPPTSSSADVARCAKKRTHGRQEETDGDGDGAMARGSAERAQTSPPR